MRDGRIDNAGEHRRRRPPRVARYGEVRHHPASEGGMGILPNHEPVLTVIKEGTIVVVDPDGSRRSFEVTDGFISFDSNKLTVAVERGRDVKMAE